MMGLVKLNVDAALAWNGACVGNNVPSLFPAPARSLGLPHWRKPAFPELLWIALRTVRHANPISERGISIVIALTPVIQLNPRRSLLRPSAMLPSDSQSSQRTRNDPIRSERSLPQVLLRLRRPVIVGARPAEAARPLAPARTGRRRPFRSLFHGISASRPLLVRFRGASLFPAD